MIEKIQCNPQNYKIEISYYNRARDAMFDAVEQLVIKGYDDIYIPGYIGWSPKEGSGIFDPLNSIEGLRRHYYRITSDLRIDFQNLNDILNNHSILLLVNYFGFRDKKMDAIIEEAHKRECVVIEDNAHGFYTYFVNGKRDSDITFFSLHKMFPFKDGGALVIDGDVDVKPMKSLKTNENVNPFAYNINAIAKTRKANFLSLLCLCHGKEDYFTPLKEEADLIENVPQTFPIVIRKGDRNRIYEVMNEKGYGVVSLYHTMIEELRNGEHEQACWLSQRVMNLPIHQDCDQGEYVSMIDALVEACKRF